MTLSLLTSPEKVQIGNAAGWHLTFHRAAAKDAPPPPDSAAPALDIGNNDYHAEIRAALPGELDSGVYSFTIEGLTDDDYKKIKLKPDDDKPLYVRLYLYWIDTNASVGGFLANVAGLTDMLSKTKGKDLPAETRVAVLRVVSVTRKAGTRRYETTITAREWVHDRVATRRVCPQAITVPGLPEALDVLLQQTARLRKDTDYKFHGKTPNPACPPKPGASGASPQVELERGRQVRELLNELGTKLEAETGRRGRGMFLIRDGCLHIGARPIPFEGAGKEPKKLSLGSGLIETEVLATVETDPNFDHCSGQKPPLRRQFKLTLKGRPDLKPGDMVQFNPPPEDMDSTGGGLLGAIGDLVGPLIPSLGGEDFSKAVKLYVASVEHKLGRTTGFVTTLTGVEIADPMKAWDCHTPARQPGSPQPTANANPETEAARAVREVAQGALEGKHFAEVGEVRQMHTSGAAEPPGQTLKVWRGLTPGDPQAYRARRVPVQRPSAAPMQAVPYATPFALGKCGLVLPRYPGTRVVVVHADGRGDDPVEVGALWESGKGPESQPGDWWLILPVDFSGSRDSIEDGETPQEHTGRVTQDLIDAAGNRVIEVGELTIRIGRGDKLKNAGERPARGDPDAVTIEHASGGAKLVIDKNGKVTITGKNIEFDAGSGNITLKANKVDVQVADSMDVR